MVKAMMVAGVVKIVAGDDQNDDGGDGQGKIIIDDLGVDDDTGEDNGHADDVDGRPLPEWNSSPSRYRDRAGMPFTGIPFTSIRFTGIPWYDTLAALTGLHTRRLILFIYLI